MLGRTQSAPRLLPGRPHDARTFRLLRTLLLLTGLVWPGVDSAVRAFESEPTKPRRGTEAVESRSADHPADTPAATPADVSPDEAATFGSAGIDPESFLPADLEPGLPPDPGLLPSPAIPTAPTLPADPLLYQAGPLRAKFSLDGVFQQSGVTGSWWNLSEEFAPDADYQPDRAWAETWIKPGLRLDLSATEAWTLYSGVAYVGSGNIGRDVFEQGNQGQWSVENAYLGARLAPAGGDSTLDLSYGWQPYKIGSGMLISVGAMNGFERGATTTFARRAWKEAGIASYTRGAWTLDGFYLNPNELLSASTNSRIAGTKLEWNPTPTRSLGLAYLNVFDSIYPYVAAPIRLIPDGRRGLNTVHAYGRWNPLSSSLPGWHVAGDFAHQWNDRINMVSNAYNLETGYDLTQLPWTPRLGYAFRVFQGDDPATAQFEKFDPLFYEGAPPLWATGSNGSFSFLNSNVVAHRLSLNLTVNPTNFFNFYYWHVLADEVNSPLQFGQGGRVVVSGGEPQLVSGVPDPHLSNDGYVEYTRVISANLFLTTGVAVSVPGQGLRALVDDSETWVGGLVNVTVKY